MPASSIPSLKSSSSKRVGTSPTAPPYYLSGEVADASELVVYTAEFFGEKRNIDVRLEHEVTETSPGANAFTRSAAGRSRSWWSTTNW